MLSSYHLVPGVLNLLVVSVADGLDLSWDNSSEFGLSSWDFSPSPCLFTGATSFSVSSRFNRVPIPECRSFDPASVYLFRHLSISKIIDDAAVDSVDGLSAGDGEEIIDAQAESRIDLGFQDVGCWIRRVSLVPLLLDILTLSIGERRLVQD